MGQEQEVPKQYSEDPENPDFFFFFWQIWLAPRQKYGEQQY